MGPGVSVVIPARNEEDFIAATLDAVFAQDPPPDEVIVVDNGSTDRTAEIARQKGARVVQEPEKGVHRARQAGLLAARYPVVAQTDADTRVEPGWLREIKAAFADPRVTATYGPVELYDAPLLDRWLARYLFPAFLRLSAILGQPNLNGANHAVRRDAALAVGGYDRPYAEDVHLGIKLKKAGGRVVYRPGQRVRTSGRRLKKGRLAFYGVHIKNIARRLLGLPEHYGPNYFADRDR